MAFIDSKVLANAAAQSKPTERLPRMIVSTEGLEGSGKTDFALRGTPRPLTMLDFDFGIEGIGGGDPALTDGVTRYAFDVMGASFGSSEAEATRQIAAEVRKFMAEFRRAIETKVRTLVVDTFTAAWAGQRVARKEDRYVEMEEEFKALIRLALASPYTNLILIHHLKKDWARSKDGKSYPSGTYSRDGMDGILTMVQLGIRQRYVQPIKNGAAVIEPGRFETEILKARDNVGLVGSVMPSMDFVTLCSVACPSIDWSK